MTRVMMIKATHAQLTAYNCGFIPQLDNVAEAIKITLKNE